jgi:hypothetical protein
MEGRQFRIPRTPMGAGKPMELAPKRSLSSGEGWGHSLLCVVGAPV